MGSVLNLRCRALFRNLAAHRAFQKGKVPDPADLFLVRLAFDELHVMYAANGRSLPILYETHLSHPRHSKHESPLFPRGLCQIKRERLLWRESSAEPLKQAVQNSSQSVRDLITSLDHPAHSMIAVDLGDWDQCWSLDGPQCVARAGAGRDAPVCVSVCSLEAAAATAST
jgi:hypothetical protein